VGETIDETSTSANKGARGAVGGEGGEKGVKLYAREIEAPGIKASGARRTEVEG